MKFIDMCPICNAQLTNSIKQFHSMPNLIANVHGLNMVVAPLITYRKCLVCGAFVQSPRMEDEHIIQYYSEGHYRAWLGVEQEDMDTDEMGRAIVDAKHIREVIGDVEKHLDCGSSRGYLLEKVGADYQIGIEPNEEYNTNEEAAIFPSLDRIPHHPAFDLVTAIHSLEHTTDPIRTLQDLSDRCNKYLVIEVPSDESPGGWGRLAHTFHFPPETLIYMANKIGWRITHMFKTPHQLVVMEKV